MAYPGPTFDNCVFSNTTNLTINSTSILINGTSVLWPGYTYNVQGTGLWGLDSSATNTGFSQLMVYTDDTNTLNTPVATASGSGTGAVANVAYTSTILIPPNMYPSHKRDDTNFL